MRVLTGPLRMQSSCCRRPYIVSSTTHQYGVLQTAQEQILQQIIHLIKVMSRNCKESIQVKGGHPHNKGQLILWSDHCTFIVLRMILYLYSSIGSWFGFPLTLFNKSFWLLRSFTILHPQPVTHLSKLLHINAHSCMLQLSSSIQLPEPQTPCPPVYCRVLSILRTSLVLPSTRPP